MNNKGIDNQLTRTTPEGVEISLIPAGVTARSCAYLFDFMIRAAVLLAFAIVLGFMGDAGQGILLVLYFVISWGYYIIFEARDGQTPGKKRLHIKVVQDNGLPARFNHIVLRNLLRPADAFPFSYLAGIIVMSSGKQFKRIGDWAAGTLVVHTDSQKQRANLTLDSSTPLSSPNPTPPAFNLSTEEQQAVLAFIERKDKLSESRQIELANLLADMLGVEGESANQKLQQIAQYYAGQQV